MTLWLVISYDGPVGVYSSLELAEEAKRFMGKTFTYAPEEYTLDELPEERAGVTKKESRAG
jgi:hypothetical protein